MANDIYQFNCTDIRGKNISMEDYRGSTLLIVNTASKCGFTPQLKELQKLYQKYKEQGLVVLGFPCNQFGQQEPGSESEISSFCSTSYDVNFPLFSKIEVNGDNADPLFQFLKSEATGVLGSSGIKWNFTKFLVNKTGQVLKRFAPKDKPENIESEITAVL